MAWLYNILCSGYVHNVQQYLEYTLNNNNIPQYYKGERMLCAQ